MNTGELFLTRKITKISMASIDFYHTKKRKNIHMVVGVN